MHTYISYTKFLFNNIHAQDGIAYGAKTMSATKKEFWLKQACMLCDFKSHRTVADLGNKT